MSMYNSSCQLHGCPSAHSHAAPPSSLIDETNTLYKLFTNTFMLNNQLNLDLEQQNLIKLQQIEAVRLIQISLDKLTQAATIQIPNKSNNSNKSTVLVYKEANLHKNLLVSKILNKAKNFYYQTVVQNMRLSLLNKLNYYSSLVQHLYNTNTNNSNLSTSTNTASASSSAPSMHSTSEALIIDEMKLLMQQILHETYQFNLTQPVVPHEATTSPSVYANFYDEENNRRCQSAFCDTLNANQVIPVQSEAIGVNSKRDEAVSSDNEQVKRIKQLNDVKLSLYSLLFTNQHQSKPQQSNHESQSCHQKATQKNLTNKRELLNDDEQEENNLSSRISKKTKCDRNQNEPTQTHQVDLNNNHLILSDDTNVIHKNKSTYTRASSNCLPKKHSQNLMFSKLVNNKPQQQQQVVNHGSSLSSSNTYSSSSSSSSSASVATCAMPVTKINVLA
jgi:hypothetical protein